MIQPTQTITTARPATLADLTDLHRELRAQRGDVGASATASRSKDGMLVIEVAGERVIDERGVASSTGRFRASGVERHRLRERISEWLVRRRSITGPRDCDLRIALWARSPSKTGG